MSTSTAATPPTTTSPTSSSGSASLPPLSVLLSAPSLDPYISQLDEATLAQLYNQPPPLGSSLGSSASPTAVYSSPTAVDSLKAVDASLAAAIDSAWKLGLHLDAGPDSTTSSTGTSRSPLSLQSSVSSLLSSLTSLDSAARQCDVLVPQSLLEQLDDGRNPERSLADVMDSLIANNDRSRGRAIATHSLSEAIGAYVEAAAARESEARAAQQQSAHAKREVGSVVE